MDDYYLGTILLWSVNWCPKDWMYCAGQNLPVALYQPLYSLIGTTYGGTPDVSFNLPDLRSRVPVGGGMGSSPSVGINIDLGQSGGHDTVALNQTQIPAHTHALMVNNGQSNTNVPAGGLTIAAPNTPAGRSTTPTNGFLNTFANTQLDLSSIGNTGSGMPHDNMQPYLGISYIICVNGIYPSRQ